MSNDKYIRVTVRQWVYAHGATIELSSRRGSLKFSGPNRVVIVEKFVNIHGTEMKLLLTPPGEFAVVVMLPESVFETLKVLKSLKHRIDWKEIARLKRNPTAKLLHDFVYSRVLVED